MIDDIFVIDGVGHAYDFSPSNMREGCDPARHRAIATHSFEIAHSQLESKAPGYKMTLREFSARWHPEDLAHAFFVESDVDMVVHHSVQIGSYFPEGTPGWSAGVALKKAAPHRVLLHGCVDPFDPDRSRVFAKMEQMAADGAAGFKFYPSNGFFDRDQNKLVAMFYNDPDLAYPFFEKARSLGVRHLSFHKAMPIGQGPTDAAHVEDVSTAAAMFPDMTFEVVHSGWAFLEECAIQLKLHKNIYANLECTMNLIVRQPMRFAHVLGTLLQYALPEQILFASGCAISHVDPILQAFAKFEMPRELREGYDYPEVTRELKRKILGGNMARLHGLTAEDMKKASNDEWSRLRAQGKAAPWSAHRKRVNAPDYPWPGYEPIVADTTAVTGAR